MPDPKKQFGKTCFPGQMRAPWATPGMHGRPACSMYFHYFIAVTLDIPAKRCYCMVWNGANPAGNTLVPVWNGADARRLPPKRINIQSERNSLMADLINDMIIISSGQTARPMFFR